MEAYGKNYVPDKMWSNKTNEEEDMPLAIKAFLVEIVSVCKKHGYSISHEDAYGAFIIEGYSDKNMEWLCNASNNVEG